MFSYFEHIKYIIYWLRIVDDIRTIIQRQEYIDIPNLNI